MASSLKGVALLSRARELGVEMRYLRVPPLVGEAVSFMRWVSERGALPSERSGVLYLQRVVGVAEAWLTDEKTREVRELVGRVTSPVLTLPVSAAREHLTAWLETGGEREYTSLHSLSVLVLKQFLEDRRG